MNFFAPFESSCLGGRGGGRKRERPRATIGWDGPRETDIAPGNALRPPVWLLSEIRGTTLFLSAFLPRSPGVRHIFLPREGNLIAGTA